MTTKELEQVIDERSKKQIDEAKASIIKELGDVSIPEAKLNEAVEKAVKTIQKENEKDLNSNANLLLNFEKANAAAAQKGILQETPVSVVNQMIGSALVALDKTGLKNAAQLTPDQILASAKVTYPESKALHAVLDQRQKDYSAGTPSAGGFTIPIAFSPDYIKALYAKTLLDKLGVRKVPMPNGNFSIPRMDTSSAVGWLEENGALGLTTAAFGEVNLKAKKMGALSAISNSLMRQSGVGIESWISDDLMEKARILLDYTFMYGTGTEHTPRGLANQANIQTVGSSSTAFGLTTPIDMEALLEQANIPMDNVKWLFSPIGKSWIYAKAFSSGPFAWADEMSRGKLLSYDFLSSSTVSYTPANGGTAAYSDFWIGDFSQFIWGVGYDLSFEMSREGSYVSGGSTVSAFQKDLTLVRLISEHDFACRQPKAFVKGTYSQT